MELDMTGSVWWASSQWEMSSITVLRYAVRPLKLAFKPSSSETNDDTVISSLSKPFELDNPHDGSHGRLRVGSESLETAVTFWLTWAVVLLRRFVVASPPKRRLLKCSLERQRKGMSWMSPPPTHFNRFALHFHVGGL
jgi:hypothetical protein